MREIIVSDPKINETPQEYRRYSWKSHLKETIISEFNIMAIYPWRYPRAIELFAGDAPVAAILRDLNWYETNLTCVDHTYTNTPLVENVHWKYWDLRELGWAIIHKEQLPKEVREFQQKFDAAISIFAETDEPTINNLGLTLCQFFVRRGGYIYTNDSPTSKIH